MTVREREQTGWWEEREREKGRERERAQYDDIIMYASSLTLVSCYRQCI